MAEPGKGDSGSPPPQNPETNGEQLRGEKGFRVVFKNLSGIYTVVRALTQDEAIEQPIFSSPAISKELEEAGLPTHTIIPSALDIPIANANFDRGLFSSIESTIGLMPVRSPIYNLDADFSFRNPTYLSDEEATKLFAAFEGLYGEKPKAYFMKDARIVEFGDLSNGMTYSFHLPLRDAEQYAVGNRRRKEIVEEYRGKFNPEEEYRWYKDNHDGPIPMEDFETWKADKKIWDDIWGEGGESVVAEDAARRAHLLIRPIPFKLPDDIHLRVGTRDEFEAKINGLAVVLETFVNSMAQIKGVPQYGDLVIAPLAVRNNV